MSWIGNWWNSITKKKSDEIILWEDNNQIIKDEIDATKHVMYSEENKVKLKNLAYQNRIANLRSLVVELSKERISFSETDLKNQLDLYTNAKVALALYTSKNPEHYDYGKFYKEDLILSQLKTAVYIEYAKLQVILFGDKQMTADEAESKFNENMDKDIEK